MPRYRSLIYLFNDIDTDEKVLTFAMEHGLIYDKQSDRQSDKQSFPTCEEPMGLSSRMAVDGAFWKCQKRSYRKSITLRLGLVLVRSKMPLKTFILYLYF